MISVAETELQVNSTSIESPMVVFDKPHRGLVIVLDEEFQMRDTNSSRTRVLAFEGTHYKGGVVRLFDHTYLDGPKRAIVIVLDEAPHIPTTQLPNVDEPMRDPVQVGNLIFDLEQAVEIYDEGDHIVINFGVLHQPPLLILTGEKVNQFRSLGLQVNTPIHTYLSDDELSSIQQKLAQDESVDQATVLRLVEDIRAFQESRRQLLDTVGRTLQAQINSCEQLLKHLAENRVQKVRCAQSPECVAFADGSCTCDEPVNW